jgi:hypothetical protein
MIIDPPEGIWASTTAPGHTDAFAIADGLWFCGIGSLIALLFWWLAVFRNETFPSVPRSVPWGMLLLIPLVIGGMRLHRSFDPEFFQGLIVAVEGEAPTRHVTVRLSDGQVVPMEFFNDDRPTSVMLNQCWHIMKHWSIAAWQRVYSLEAPFGAGGNEC